MVTTIVREFKWTPSEINKLYVDGVDFESLIFWYKDIEKVIKEMKAKK